jgi:hypothetical protein
LLGTALRVYGKKQRATTRAARRAGLRLLWTGVGLGLLGAVLWALGLQVLPLTWSPEWSEVSRSARSSATWGRCTSRAVPARPDEVRSRGSAGADYDRGREPGVRESGNAAATADQ